jgi:hypothetical protein
MLINDTIRCQQGKYEDVTDTGHRVINACHYFALIGMLCVAPNSLDSNSGLLLDNMFHPVPQVHFASLWS